MFFNKLFQRSEEPPSPARRSYEKIVAQARHPEFYLNGGIEDTVDGRFDMIVLHAVIFIARLNEDNTEESKAASQAVFDEMFRDMDRSLREMGVGDLSVGKKVKKMAQVFYGRAKAYDDAMKAYVEKPEELESAVARNLFAERQHNDEPRAFAKYMMACRARLGETPQGDLCAGTFEFAAPDTHFGDTA